MVALCWLLLSCTDSVGTEDSGLWTTPTDSATEPTRGPVQRDDHAHIYPDADRDGWTSDRDCDDQDPWTHPWAAEWCDPVDHDCDGEPLAEGVCGKVQTLEAIQSTWIGGDPWFEQVAYPTFAGDLDGEPGDELLVWTWHNPDGGDYVYKSIAVISDVPEAGLSITEVAESTVFGGCCAWEYWRGAGDFNGDGLGDVVLGDHESHVSGYAETFLLLGPHTDWSGANWIADVASQTWRGDFDEVDGRLEFMDAGGDLDGDGRAELLLGGDLLEPARVVLLMGRSDIDGGELAYASEVGIENLSAAPLGFVDDLDGDGLNDLVATGSKFSWVSGADVPSGGVLDWESVEVRSSLTDPDRCIRSDTGDQDEVPHIGDWSGDGVEDLLLSCEGQISLAGEPSIHVIDGSKLPTSEPDYDLLDLSLGSWEVLTSEHEIGIHNIHPLGDVDEDGLPDIAYGVSDRPGDQTIAYQRWLRSGLGLPGPLTEASQDYTVGSLGAAQGLAWQVIGTAGDLDGDGRVDVASYLEDIPSEDNTSGYAFSVHIILGWDLPWHDPTYF